jgi:hypothetical protein
MKITDPPREGTARRGDQNAETSESSLKKDKKDRKSY